jgi:hypothetical protein
VYGGGALSTAADAIYLDGVPLSIGVVGGTPALATTELKIGGVPTVTSCCAFTGSVDEFRVSSGTRSGDWIAAEFANQSAPWNFYTMGGVPTPVISNITPSLGPTGTQVTIQGSNFGSTQGSGFVTFNGATATSIASWTSSQIVASVPSAAPSGTGPVTVTVNSASSHKVPAPSSRW